MIVDAERPPTPLDAGHWKQTVESTVLAEAGDPGDENKRKMSEKYAKFPKISLNVKQNHENISKMAPQIGPKSKSQAVLQGFPIEITT